MVTVSHICVVWAAQEPGVHVGKPGQLGVLTERLPEPVLGCCPKVDWLDLSPRPWLSQKRMRTRIRM